ncbi:MAG TPA: TonB family protein [Thermoanaerobaculia bacterium]|nr:TonB family protein [Thermoanaerobaculia bacterium]
MSATVLVVEYEPRYLDRLRQAFAGRPFTAVFAKDGEEALRVLEAQKPVAVLVSWILPKTSAADLIRAIRARPEGAAVPIILTVSGYNGRDPRADAKRVGADDLLPKPFSEADLLARIAAALGIELEAVHRLERELGDFSIDPPPRKHPASQHAVAAQQSEKLTSDEIFGEVLGDDPAARRPPIPPPPAKPPSAPATSSAPSAADLDDLLDRTLITLKKKKADPARSAASAGRSLRELDQLVEDTLSGLPRARRRGSGPDPARPAAPEPIPPTGPAPSSSPPGEVTMTARPGARFGQFVLRAKIATGGMAEVWKAQMQGVEGFEKLVAIKRILPHLAADQEFVSMFIDEAKIAARLNHPNIIHIYDLGLASGSHYIAMELVDGHDLKSTLRRAGERRHPLPPELALFIGSKIAAALDYAHRKEEGLVHRDVSPQNVLISWDGDIKLCDFGIAKAASKVSHTQSGALKGKLQYMSPEQASGKGLDQRSDIFSLGVILFEMLTGRKLFSAENELSILEQVRDPKVPPPSEVNDEVPPALDPMVLRVLARDPDARFKSAADVAREIDHVLYAFRPAPTAADLAVWMHRIWRDEPLATVPIGPAAQAASADESLASSPSPAPLRTEPEVEIPAPAPGARAAASHAIRDPQIHARAPQAHAAESRPNRRLLWIASALLALAVVGGTGTWIALRPDGAPVITEPVTRAAAVLPPAETPRTLGVPPELPAAEDPVVEAEPVVPQPSLSAEEVEREVQRRLDAERQRLEQIRRRQLAEAREAERRAVPAPPPVRETIPSETPAERPPAPPRTDTITTAAEPEREPSPPPQPTETAAVVREPEPELEPAAPPPVRRGDFVPPGTPGLIEPTVVSLRRVSYPPVAKLRRIEGVVVLQVLVSETGEPLEVKVLRGIGADVGIDEAALAAVRGGLFRPATKDGIPVKARKTVTVPFKL